MGLFDTILGGLAGSSGTAQPGLFDEVTGIINQHGGIQGLVQSLQNKGLGDAVASWVGTDANLPISSEQIHQFLGSDQVQAIAQKLGISTNVAADSLAQLLPQVIDRLTPGGQIPQGNLLNDGLNVIKNELFRS